MRSPTEEEGRAMVMHRALGRCEVRVTDDCRPGEAEWHHRQSRRAGDHRPSNGLAACRPCHTWIHANPAAARVNGWMLPVNGVPKAIGDVAALVHPRGEGRQTWVTLTSGGTYIEVG